MKNTNIIHVGSRTMIESSDILYLQSDINYTKIFLTNGNMLYVSTTLKIIENRLSFIKKFLRINRSTIINLSYVENQEGPSIKLINKNTFRFSRRRLKSMLNDQKIIS